MVPYHSYLLFESTALYYYFQNIFFYLFLYLYCLYVHKINLSNALTSELSGLLDQIVFQQQMKDFWISFLPFLFPHIIFLMRSVWYLHWHWWYSELRPVIVLWNICSISCNFLFLAWLASILFHFAWFCISSIHTLMFNKIAKLKMFRPYSFFLSFTL